MDVKIRKIDHLNYKGTIGEWFTIIPVKLEKGG